MLFQQLLNLMITKRKKAFCLNSILKRSFKWRQIIGKKSFLRYETIQLKAMRSLGSSSTYPGLAKPGGFAYF